MNSSSPQQQQLISKLQTLNQRLHHEFCQSEQLKAKLCAKAVTSNNAAKMEAINRKMELFKQRFHEQRRETKANSAEMAQAQCRLQELTEKQNYLEKEIQSLAKQDENQQLIVQNLEEDTTELQN